MYDTKGEYKAGKPETGRHHLEWKRAYGLTVLCPGERCRRMHGESSRDIDVMKLHSCCQSWYRLYSLDCH